MKAACPARRRRSRWGRGPACSVQGPSAPPEATPPAVAFLLFSVFVADVAKHLILEEKAPCLWKGGGEEVL